MRGLDLQIRVDDLSGSAIRALLEEHLRQMHELSPPESVHALDLAALQAPDITFWTAWSEGGTLLGCGALRQIDPLHGEIKSMRTASLARRQGVARSLLAYILAQAQQRGLRRLSLETGAQAGFDPARRLYAQFGFVPCGPFAGYGPDPDSVFMTREIPAG